jgi:septum formation inhibitor MinC
MQNQQMQKNGTEYNSTYYYPLTVVMLSSSKPNRDLSASEREAKRALQSQVKEQKLRIYWERRIAFAIKCKDNVKLQRAQDELNRRLLLLDHDDEQQDDEQQQQQQQQQQTATTDRNDKVIAKSRRQEEACLANKFIEAIYEQLMRPKSNKGRRADTSLLKHMRKGTQEHFMFDNVDAIWGYTSCKFCERAMYVVSSLSKLAPTANKKNITNDGYQSLWNRLLAVSTVCCIGSGPGNDAVGILSFLGTFSGRTSHDAANSHNEPCLKRLVFLDFAMQQWKVITDHLASILVPHHVEQLDLDYCDVTVSCRSDDSNCNALRMLRGSEKQFDLFLLSFILTETHGQWEDFVLELIDLAERHALFYFAEPRPWQLHRLVELSEGRLDFVWIDSSMNNPSLQSLGTRVGPAILVGLKL